VKRLGDEHRACRAVPQRDPFGSARKHLRLRHISLQHPPHPSKRLHCDHMIEPVDKHPRQLASASSEIEHRFARNPGQHLARPARPTEVVVLSEIIERHAVRVTH